MPNAKTENWGGGISFLSEATQHSLLYARLASYLPPGDKRTLLENLADAISDGLEAAQAQEATLSPTSEQDASTNDLALHS